MKRQKNGRRSVVRELSDSEQTELSAKAGAFLLYLTQVLCVFATIHVFIRVW